MLVDRLQTEQEISDILRGWEDFYESQYQKRYDEVEDVEAPDGYGEREEELWNRM